MKIKFAIFLLAMSCSLLSHAQIMVPDIIQLSLTPIAGGGATDVWGYVDDTTGIEYAIVGDWTSVSIVDVSNPASPNLVSFIDSIAGFDVKIWGHYLYAIHSGTSKPGLVFDINDPANPVLVDSFPGTHNIFIDEQGYLYASFPGITIYDLNGTPGSPQVVWNDTTADGHDAAVVDSIMYFFGGYAGTFIYNVANPAAPVLIDQIVDPGINYHHSGWPTEDGNYLLICDELAKHPASDISVWDISVIGNPQKVDEFADPNAIVHNVYIIDNWAYVSYYMEGFRIFDVSDPTNLNLVANFETFPDSSTEGFNGAFGVYPFAPSGNVYVSDMKYGLYVFGIDTVPLAINENLNEKDLTLQVFPSPVNETTIIKFEIDIASDVEIQLVDLQGKICATWKSEHSLHGVQNFDWSTLFGDELIDGMYVLRMLTNSGTGIRKILVRNK